jgi:L-threonylcarbamoyladenylate synthase
MRRFEKSETAAMAAVLKQGGVISVPTDTVYGVCCMMNSREAQEHLRDIKHRPADKAFPVMCADEAQIRTIAEVDARAEKLIRAFLPGPVTLILKKRAEVPAYVNGGMATLAVRMAPEAAVKDLILAAGCPLFMTSANLSGQPTAKTLDEIERDCPDLDGMMKGEPSYGRASTIIDCSGDEVKILRPGPVGMEQIQQALSGN